MILMLPVWDIRIFSILRSGRGVRATLGKMKKQQTAVNDVVLVAIVEGASDLSCEFASNALAQSTMADDVIEHLTAVDILKDHVVVMLMDDHFAHAANVGVM